MKITKVYIGSDHAGYEVKKDLIEYLAGKYDFEIVDCGTESTESVDYPQYAHKVASGVSTSEDHRGILICGTGNGVCMTANKHQGVRAGLVWEKEIAVLIRQHNNANVICMPARFISYRKMQSILNAYFTTEFEGGRHQRRIDQIPC